MSGKAPSIRQLHLLSGSLVGPNRQQIPYWPVEISQFSFWALVDTPVQLGGHILFLHTQGSTRLAVQEIKAHYRGTGYTLVKLLSPEADINIEQELRKVPELKRWNPLELGCEPIKLPIANLHVRCARFDTTTALRIHARTFGTRGDFVMHTENVSKSGMLLKEHRDAAPFSVNTILELTVDPEARHFAEPLRCLAKIVRQDSQARTSRYGIQLIDMDQVTLIVWSGYVEELERSIMLVATATAS